MFNLFDNDNEDFNNLLQMAGKDILINNTPARAIITNPKLNVIIDYDDRYISTLSPIKRGDVIDYIDNKYFVITETVSPRHSKYKSIIRNCNYSIKFVLNGQLHEGLSIIESRTFDVDNGQYITMPTGKILVTHQQNEITDNIERDQRFIKMGSPWKVVGVDKSKKGLIRLTCDVDVFVPGDDIENEIANADRLVTYNVYFTSDNISMILGATLQLNVVVTANGQIVSENVLFESSDELIASVGTNGLVTAHEEGNVSITARLQRDPRVYDVIQINVEEIVEDDYSIHINGSDSIRQGQTLTYAATVYNNAQEVTEPVTFALFADNQSSTTTSAVITSQNANSCSIRNDSNSGYVQLRATLNSDNSIVAWKRIQLRGVF
ncbi:Ig-like domain-containing protein [Bacillus horti]|uniref:BIG2 domain-containing protein n=1 Tax=Caldalkalibacillus horti TaxID=77523 RepID=A0ABT9W4N7_9BACI|nr:Ig-like domain-containing protein [Bacillus horti]MDQ0168218.1 hypothetical protein [Bacillus horti]